MPVRKKAAPPARSLAEVTTEGEAAHHELVRSVIRSEPHDPTVVSLVWLEGHLRRLWQAMHAGEDVSEEVAALDLAARGFGPEREAVRQLMHAISSVAKRSDDEIAESLWCGDPARRPSIHDRPANEGRDVGRFVGEGPFGEGFPPPFIVEREASLNEQIAGLVQIQFGRRYPEEAERLRAHSEDVANAVRLWRRRPGRVEGSTEAETLRRDKDGVPRTKFEAVAKLAKLAGMSKLTAKAAERIWAQHSKKK